MSFGLGRGRELDTTGFGFTTADLPPLEEPRIGAEFFFGSSAPRRFEIEIGSGKGTFLLQEAPKYPETLFLGIEYAGEPVLGGIGLARQAIQPHLMRLKDGAQPVRSQTPADRC